MISRLLVSHAVLAACAAVLAAGGSAAAAPGPPPLPPRCAGQLAARFTDTATDGAVHRMTIVLSTTARTACTLAGFPELVLPSAQSAPLPAGHLTLTNVVVLAPGSTASFALRYMTSQEPATAPDAPAIGEQPLSQGLPHGEAAKGRRFREDDCCAPVHVDAQAADEARP